MDLKRVQITLQMLTQIQEEKLQTYLYHKTLQGRPPPAQVLIPTRLDRVKKELHSNSITTDFFRRNSKTNKVLTWLIR